MEQNKTKIKIGIYAMSMLMMGVIGVSGALTVIAQNFPDASQTMIQNIISIPCLVVLPVTLIVGKLMDFFSKKMIGIVGIIAFLIGGVIPAFISSLPLILVFRGILGIGIGIVQPVASALVAENFEGPERDKVQGNMTSAQMLGCAIMVFAGGWLGSVSWNLPFYVHGIALISLVVVVLLLPNVKPEKQSNNGNVQKTKLTKSSWSWAISMFILFIGAQIYSVYLSFIVDEKALGTAAQSGNAMAFFAFGGFLMGILFGKLAGTTKNMTYAVGLFGIALSYLLIAFAGSMIVIYIGAFVFGLSLSICMPTVVVGTAGSVDPASAAMAISITMCAQNLAQFLCPYIINPITASLGNGASPNKMAFLLGIGIHVIMGIYAVIWGLRKNKTAS